VSRYSPTIAPDYGENYGDILASGIESYVGQKRREKADTRAEEEYAYTKGRREKLDPIEEALLRAQLYERGVVPSDGESGGALPDAIEGERDRGGDLISGRAHFGDQGLQPATGLRAPGSFNPATGGFNPPIDPGFERPGPARNPDPGFGVSPPAHDPDPGFSRGTPGRGRVPLGGGYELDPSRTKEGRAESALAAQIEAAVRSGIPRDEAEIEARSGGISSEHFHLGTFHPKTRQEYNEIEAQQHRYRLEEISAQEAARRRGDKDRDPRWEERRKSWVKQLGDPADEMEQDILDALASGYSTDEILETMPASRKSRAQRYLRRASRREQRGAPAEPEE
jgi:hypothetical protein